MGTAAAEVQCSVRVSVEGGPRRLLCTDVTGCGFHVVQPARLKPPGVVLQAVPVAWSSLPSSGSRFSRLADTVISATPHKSNIAVRLDVHALEREALRAAVSESFKSD
jgi:hypothetical protein